MEKVYRPQKFYRKLGIASIIGFLLFWGGATFMSLRSGSSTTLSILVIELIFGIFPTFSILYTYHVFIERLTITDEEIVYKGGLGTKRIRLSDISGFRIVNTKYYSIVEFVPVSQAIKPLKIGMYFENGEEILEWLTSNFSNLTEEERRKELAKILSNKKYGRSEEERNVALDNAKSWSKFITLISIISSVGLLLSPLSLQLKVVVASILPFVVILIIRIFNGLIIIGPDVKRVRPDGLIAVSVSTLPIIISIYSFYEILNFKAMVLPGLIVVTAVFGLVYWIGKVCFTSGSMQSVIVLSLLLGFSLVYVHNQLWDRSVATVHRVKVTDNFEYRKSKTGYVVVLEPWEYNGKTDTISVSKDDYDDVRKNGMVTFYVHEGFFFIPWHYRTPYL